MNSLKFSSANKKRGYGLSRNPLNASLQQSDYSLITSWRLAQLLFYSLAIIAVAFFKMLDIFQR